MKYLILVILLAQANPQPIIIGPLPPPVIVEQPTQPTESTGTDAIYSPWQPEIREGATGSDAIYSPWK